MTLRDTLAGARAEAEANRTLADKSSKDKDEKSIADELEEGAGQNPVGFSKRSVARAKPSREAAASVRVVGSKSGSGSSSAPVSKEERRARRQRERDEEDRKASVSQILLENDENYKPVRRIWWILIGIGFAALAVSVIVMGVAPGAANDLRSTYGMIAIVSTIAAYVAIIAAFVWDWRKIRPLRKRYEAMSGSLSKRKVTELLEDDRKKRDAKRAEKDAK